MKVLRAPRVLGVVALACCALAMPWPRAHAAHESTGARDTLRVLLIGNSYTRFNMMPRLLERIAEAAPLGDRVQVDVEARGGSTLRRHWRDGRALALIRSGRYTHVVLQDHSLRPVDRPAEFHAYVERFQQAIAAASARTVLYGTWPRHPSARLYREHAFLRSFEQMAEQVDGAYRSAAERLAAEFAPVGPAFEHVLSARPSLPLYRKDATHPTLAGSFLAACVLYGTVTGADPRQSSYVPWELDPEQAEWLKAAAAATLEQYGK